MARYAEKIDANQKAIVDALKRIGCDVYSIGQPVDLVVGYRARNFLMEVKNPNGKNELTDAQKEFIATWRGQVRVVRSADEAIRLVTGVYEN